MLRRRSLLLGLALASLSVLAPLSACAWEHETIHESGKGPRIEGSGRVSEQRRSLPAFSRLRLEDSLDVQAKPGSNPQITVRADDNIIDLIETVVEGDTLVLRCKPRASFRTRTPIRLQLDFSSVQAVTMQGSGDLTLQAPQGDRLSVSLSGSGDLRVTQAALTQLSIHIAGSGDVSASGQTAVLRASIAGSGDLNTLDLAARETTVSIAGSGDAQVNASESLKVSIAGSGTVRYSGKPAQISRNIVGSGELQALK